MILKQMFDLPTYGWKSAFDDLESMRQNIYRLSGQVSGRPYWQAHAGVFPLVNITEGTDHFFIRAEIPGMESKQIDISATSRSLTITGERIIISEGKGVKYHRREREGGTFNRVIAMPGDIQTDKIVAEYTNGVLVITIPKAEAAIPKRIMIK